MKRIGWSACIALLAMALGLTGCASREHKKTVVIHETKEGEVHEDAPGEMVVE